MANLPDSGKRTTFAAGGAVREADPDKPALEGISPYALRRLGMLLARANVKYGDYRNWEKGMPITRYIGAIGRHNGDYLARKVDEDHMAAVMWNAMAILHHEAVGAYDPTTGQHWTFEELDDRPVWDPPPIRVISYQENSTWLTKLKFWLIRPRMAYASRQLRVRFQDLYSQR